MPSEPLEPCPWATLHRIKSSLQVRNVGDYWCVVCMNGCRGPAGLTEEEARRLWNQRTEGGDDAKG